VFDAAITVSSIQYAGREARLVLVNEITEQKRMAESLRLSEERFRMALRGSPNTVAALHRDLRYTWVYNPLPGFTVELMIGRRLDELLPAADMEEMLRVTTVYTVIGGTSEVQRNTVAQRGLGLPRG
jgi:PAS domain-containing protein